MYNGLIDRSGGSVGRSSPCACASALALVHMPLLLRGHVGDFNGGNSDAGCGGRYGDHGCDRDDHSGIAIVMGMISVAAMILV